MSKCDTSTSEKRIFVQQLNLTALVCFDLLILLCTMRTAIFKRGNKEYDLQIDGINTSCLLRVFNVCIVALEV